MAATSPASAGRERDRSAPTRRCGRPADAGGRRPPGRAGRRRAARPRSFQAGRAAAAAQLKRELPGQVGAVVNARVEALAAERAGQVPGVTQQEAPPVGKLGDQPAVHAERGRPGDFPHPDSLPDPSLDRSRPPRPVPGSLASCSASPSSRSPTKVSQLSAGQRHEQDIAFRAGDQCPAVARQAALHDPAGDQRRCPGRSCPPASRPSIPASRCARRRRR